MLQNHVAGAARQAGWIAEVRPDLLKSTQACGEMKMKSIKTKVIELLQLAHGNPVLVEKIGTAAAAENRIDALLEFSTQNAMDIERADLSTGCKALADSDIAGLSDEEIQEITGGLVGWNTATEMACMVYQEQAFAAKIEKMRSQGCSEEYISEFISVRNHPGKKMVISPRSVE